MSFTSPQRFLLESDRRLRSLERMAASGDPEAVAAYKTEAFRYRANSITRLLDDTIGIFELRDIREPPYEDSAYTLFTDELVYSDEYVAIVGLAETIRNQLSSMKSRGDENITNKQLRKLIINLKRFTKVEGPGTSGLLSAKTLYPRKGGKWSDSPEAANLLGIIDGLELLV